MDVSRQSGLILGFIAVCNLLKSQGYVNLL